MSNTTALLNKIGELEYAGRPGIGLGPYILGMFMDCLLFGICACHAIQWAQHSWNSDSWQLRATVVAVGIGAFAGTAFTVAWIMDLFAYNFGSYGGFVELDWALWYYLLETVVRTPVSVYFALRAYRLLGRSKILLAIVLPLILTSAVMAVIIAVAAKHMIITAVANDAQGAGELASDIIVTVSIAVQLLRSRTGWESTDRLVKKLLISATFIVIYAVDPASPLQKFFIWIPKLYFLALLMVLNSRVGLRRELENNFSVYPTQGRQTAIKVTTETYTESYQLDDVPSQHPKRTVAPLLRKVDETEELEGGAGSAKTSPQSSAVELR
ncbi:hypothetical protein Q5752_005864 [Cryptotrichosporon argae]